MLKHHLKIEKKNTLICNLAECYGNFFPPKQFSKSKGHNPNNCENCEIISMNNN